MMTPVERVLAEQPPSWCQRTSLDRSRFPYLGVPQGAEGTLLAEGSDAEAVLDSLSKLLADDFD